MYFITHGGTKAQSYWAAGHTGSGVTVALIDSGTVGVEGLTTSGKVINGADLSFESQDPDLRYLDTYGHGTHMAGIISGKDANVPGNLAYADDRYFLGMAPNARILNVKVADYGGAVDVSQVIAAIDWVVEHRNDNGMNVKVINLSFGTDGTQTHLIDPLARAVEVAWLKGIVVVVAAGNDGNSAALRNPAYDPFVIAVGATDPKGTDAVSDDVVTSFTNCGTDTRHVDLVAPGSSVVSLRNPGSAADVEFPSAQVGTRFFKGTGTSQATAVVSGAAALVVSQRPGITPDQVKALLMNTASPIPGASSNCQGAGTLNLEAALYAPTPVSVQTAAPGTGAGSIEGSRGTYHLVHQGDTLDGEWDIFGKRFDAKKWADKALAETSWSGGSWNGASWSGTSWSGTSWSGTSWSGISWSGTSWSGASWSGASWSGGSWSGASWSGGSWSGASWSAGTWSGGSWSGGSWSGASWSGLSWGKAVR
jgi:serine protease AprX